ncbi:hypothetical protein [Planomicrobium okeanokoites]|uniref:hypothetical protein n=1 Tax=Planomicrobium okeanokoites TaxID=244 RepID=UPI0024932D45|nr:hypothetical protein [Planomicrobium okeanokoites]
MALPIKPLADFAIKHGPKAINFIGSAYGAATGANKIVEEHKKKKLEEGKLHYRKQRYIEYNQKILKNLDHCQRAELLKYKMEVSQFIQQIDSEAIQEMKTKKPLHNKRRKNWESILVQVDAKLKSKDYQEYLKIYNNNEYTSIYFEGFEGNVKTFKQLIEKKDSDEIIIFLVRQTDMSTTIIKNDFL